jgi:metal-dependent amidase/aminoacylase/carboxypeptidase family protein
MDPKAGARECLDGLRDRFIELSHRIHAHPELGFQEEQASTWLAETLAVRGFLPIFGAHRARQFVVS